MKPGRHRVALALSLDGVTTRTASKSAVGAADADTTFEFTQQGELFSARYRGGAIADGYLIGKMTPRGGVEFRYVQAHIDGRLDQGVSTGAVSRLPDGRLQLEEEFKRITRRGSGRNVFEQILSGS